MAAPSESADKGWNLSTLFDKVYETYESLDNLPNPSNSAPYQKIVSNAIEQGEKAVHMVNKLELFSSNEQIDEISTSELKYLLLPTLLGHLTMKLANSSAEQRLESMQKAQVYLIDYLRLLKQYGITTIDPPKPFSTKTSSETTEESNQSGGSRPKTEDLASQNRTREDKINRFKRQKAVQNELNALRDELGYRPNEADEEVRRKYSLKLHDSWLLLTLDSLDILTTELTLLNEMKKFGRGKGGLDEGVGEKRDEAENGESGCSDCCRVAEKQSKNKSSVMRPFIITRNEAQKLVYGAGYPSLPTFSVDEFYQQRVDQGIFPEPTDSKPIVLKDPEEEAEKEREKEKEKKELEEDDDEAVNRAREWDEWRDEHRRGWGNTHNKG